MSRGPLVFRGPVLDRSAWAAASRDMLGGMVAAGAAPALEPLLWQQGSVLARHEEEALAEMAARPIADARASIQHVPGRILDPYAPGRVRVAWTSLPGRVPGEDWLARLAQMDDVWVPSDAQRYALLGAGLGADRVHVVREPVALPPDDVAPLALEGLHGTVFLAMLDWAVAGTWRLMLDAWCEAFAAGDDVTLLLHAYSGDGLPVDHAAEILAHVRASGHDPARIPDIVLVDESLTTDRMSGLYAAAAALCSPVLAFGRRRAALEAMAHGRPVISCALDDPSVRQGLIRSLRDAHADPAILRQMGAMSRQRIARDNDPATIAAGALERLEAVAPRARTRAARGRPRVALYGAVTRAHSLATANRNLAAALVRRGEVDLSLVEVEPSDVGVEGRLPEGPAREAALRLLYGPPEVTIRHGYPPSFARPPHGRLVVALPWEFGPIPRDWRRAITEGGVDEVWACSHHLRDHYLACGLDPEVVRMVPHGIDPDAYRPGLEPLDLPGVPGGYRFLFVGGLLWRKGIDILLDAYRTAFTAADDVTLVVKDFGSAGPYRPQDAEARVRAMAADPSGPRVAFMRDRLADDEIPRLYASCDCLVHPYRGEGYGLTVAEAMACGLPVIVPEGGSTADFCDADTALLVPSHPLTLDRTRVGDLELTGPVSVIEVSVLDLADRMRAAYARREEARAVGARASAHVRAHHTWDAAAAIVAERVRELRERAPAAVA